MPITFTHTQPHYNANMEVVRGVYVNDTPAAYSWTGTALAWSLGLYPGVLLNIVFEPRAFTRKTNTFSSPYLVDSVGSQAYYLGVPFMAYLPVSWYITPQKRGVWLAILLDGGDPPHTFIEWPFAPPPSPWYPPWPD